MSTATVLDPPGESASVPNTRISPWPDFWAGTVCVFVGLFMALMPHLLWWGKLGEPVYLADHDDLLYLSISGQAYHNHPWTLGDPTRVTGGVTTYPALQFVPGIVLAHALALGPLAVDIFWRAWTGFSMALGSYLVIRHFLRRPPPAALLTIFFLVDTGIFSANPFWRQWLVAQRLAVGQVAGLLDAYPSLLIQWRIITPGLSFAYLLLHIWLISRARDKPSHGRILLSGIGFGLLFHCYFYFWTAAGLALVMALVLDAGHRQVYFHTGWIGGLVGLPAVVSGYLIKRAFTSDWLHRTDNFLPIARFTELLLPKAAIVLLAIGFLVAWTKRRDLLYLGCLSASSLLLTNHQVVTGLQIQNFHWSYVWGPCTSLLIALLILDFAGKYSWPRLALGALSVVIALHFATGFWIRSVEGTRTAQTCEVLGIYELYRAQRLASKVEEPPANVVIAGDADFVEFAVPLENLRPLDHYCVAFSPQILNLEYAERIALNAGLAGVDRAKFLAQQEDVLTHGWGPWSRDPKLRAARLELLASRFDAYTADPSAAVDRFGVRVVARKDSVPPKGLGWELSQAGPTWHVWERTAK